MSRIGRHASVMVVATALTLAGCQTNEQTGGLFGAGGGALFGGLLGNAVGHDQTSTLIGAGLGAIGGYFVGSAIGRQLDQADQQRAAQTTRRVLTSSARRGTTRNWQNRSTGVRGSSTVVAVEPNGSGGGECRTVREVAYIKGQEVEQQSKYCRGSGGEWAAQA
ncbi:MULTISPECIES: glycine zipper domain-containing protein [unclassified Inquilinus]|uniref:glycine zipper domain-containing protein n=1 Tax=unclassified Inquilinus TaxID=2645927 RepID=UPI003F8F8219